MKNSLTRKGIAVASTFALALGAFAAISPASAVTGSADDINDIIVEHPDTTSNYLTNGDADSYTKSGTRSGTVTAQLLAGSGEDLELSGIRVRVNFGEDAGGYYFEDEDVVFSVSGSEDVINDSDSGEDDIYAYARTDATGKATFNWSVNSAGGVDEDYVYINVDYYEDEGWSGAGGGYLEWEDAEVVSFDVDRANTSGNSVSLTYTATDQFGGGISEDDTDNLRVTMMNCDGYVDPVTKSVVNGQATFTYTQPSEIEDGDYSTVEGELHYPGVANTPDECTDNETVNGTVFDQTTLVYKNGPTSSVDSDYDQYDTVITYGKFRAGNYDEDEDVATFVDEEGVYSNNNEDYATLDLIVDTEDGGAAYQDVTVSGKGLYFETVDDAGDTIFALDSIKTTTDSSGDATVWIYSHKENVSGQTVTITSGGKSTTVKVRSFMNTDIDDNNYTSEDLDAAVIKWNVTKIGGGLTAAAFSSNTAYTVKVTARDVWGNPLRGAEIDVTVAGEDNGDPAEDATLAIWGGDLERESGEDTGVLTTNANGVGFFNVRATNPIYPNQKRLFSFDMELDSWAYESGLTSELWDFDAQTSWDSGAYERVSTGFTGAQAQAMAGVKKGVVRVGAYNVTGKTVKVYVGGKLVKTATAGKAKYVTRVTGIKAGNKRVTVWVGGKRMLSTVVTVK